VERSAFWQQIQQEEAKDDEPIVIGERHWQDATPVEDGTPSAASLELDFEPVDSRHLSSLPLIKNRIVKLLKASQNNIHASNNLIITIVGRVQLCCGFLLNPHRALQIQPRQTAASLKPVYES
jgi:hypothetical protein